MIKKTVFILGVVLTSTLLLTACNRTSINLFDYTHKPAVEFVDSQEAEEQIDEILNQ